MSRSLLKKGLSGSLKMSPLPSYSFYNCVQTNCQPAALARKIKYYPPCLSEMWSYSSVGEVVIRSGVRTRGFLAPRPVLRPCLSLKPGYYKEIWPDVCLKWVWVLCAPGAGGHILSKDGSALWVLQEPMESKNQPHKLHLSLGK